MCPDEKKEMRELDDEERHRVSRRIKKKKNRTPMIEGPTEINKELASGSLQCWRGKNTMN